LGSAFASSRVGKRLFRGRSRRDVGDDAFQFDITGRAEVEFPFGDDAQRRAISMNYSVLVTEW
jgi:hypothetical protein